MLMLTRRLQVLLDDDRYHLLEAEARVRRVPIAVLVREAIDRTFLVSGGQRKAAGERLLAAERVALPPVEQLQAEIEELRGGELR